MIPLDQQKRLLAREGAVSSPYNLVRFNVETRNMEIVVMVEPTEPLALVRMNLGEVMTHGMPTWAVLHRSLISTGDN